MTRNYASAIEALNTLQSNFAAVAAVRKAGAKKNEASIPEMIEWCRKLGYEPSDFNHFKPLHIAGTKGKGSTSAFVSSILTQYGKDATAPVKKVGLFTSPHLRFVRERIQINGEMLSEEAFTRYFFDVWDRLEKHGSERPMYFRYLMLMAFHAFLVEGVDTAVVECGIGGEYDSTNVIVQPVAAAITSLGIDHVDLLGKTLPEIAWHKSGIFKKGARAFTVEQQPEAMKVLQQRAEERGVELIVVKRHPEIDTVKLGLAADFQRTNASLAIAIAAEFLHARGHPELPDGAGIAKSPLPAPFRKGLEEVRWAGRCEIRHETNPSLAWHIDGAHTLDSIDVAARWFGEQVSAQQQRSKPRILLFNQQNRDASGLATALHKTLGTALGSNSPFTHVVFCTNVTFKEAGYKPDLVSINSNASDVNRLVVQNQLAETWRALDPSCAIEVKGTIEEAVEWCRSIARESGSSEEETVVLATGSLHLVGGVIDVLES